MKELNEEDIIRMANSARKRIVNNESYTPNVLRENGRKLEGKKVKQRGLSPKAKVCIFTGTLALATILVGVTYSKAKEDLIRKKGGRVSMDRYGNVATVMPNGVEEPTAIEVITNVLDVIKEGFSKGGR